MLKFRQFITEMGALVAKGKRVDYEHQKYIEPFLPGNSKHTGNPTHELNSDHYIKGGDKIFSKGDKVILHGIKDIDGVRHVEVSSENGNKHLIPANKLNKVGARAGTNPEAAEDAQIAAIHEHITKHLAKTGQSSTTIHLPDGTKIKAAGIKKITSTEGKYKPKADAYFHDEQGKPVHYMSLKSNTYQQYGGVSHLSDHPTVKKAAPLLKAASENNSKAHHFSLNPTSSAQDRELIHKSMYGKEFGKEHGVSNVHAIYRGNISFSPNEDNSLNMKAFSFSSNKNNNETSDYVPAKILSRTDQNRNDLGIKQRRILVVPTSLRPNSLEVKHND